jgi:hypothetical protein
MVARRSEIRLRCRVVFVLEWRGQGVLQTSGTALQPNRAFQPAPAPSHRILAELGYQRGFESGPVWEYSDRQRRSLQIFEPLLMPVLVPTFWFMGEESQVS